MEIKDILKQRRKELGLTLLQVAKLVNVNEATVSRWESGHIENMRRDKISLLAKALKISPAIIMGWNEDNDDNTYVIEGNGEKHIIHNYRTLNDEGQDKLIDYSDDLVSSKRYIKNDSDIDKRQA